MFKNDGDMISKLFNAAHDAGRLLRDHPRNLAAATKLDDTPVTAADIATHQLLMTRLQVAFGSGVSVLSEEANKDDVVQYRPDADLHIIFDPLDGTSNFRSSDPAKKKEFAVLLAVGQKDHDGHVVATHGFAVFPDHQKTLYGNAIERSLVWSRHDNQQKLSARLEGDLGLNRIVVPQRFVEEKPDETVKARVQRKDFLSYVDAFRSATGYGEARGTALIWGSALPVLDANVSSRFYRAPNQSDRPGDWDLAAWDAILKAGGGDMTNLQGAPIAYGRSDSNYKHDGFICWKKSSDAQSYRRTPAAMFG